MKKLLLIACSMFLSLALYAAPVTYVIAEDSEEGDYTSLAAAVIANERDITGVNGGTVTFRIEGVWNSSDTTRVLCDGFVTGLSSGVVVTTVGDARHSGKWTNTAYRLVPTDTWNGVALKFVCDYIHVDGLQVAALDDNYGIVGFEAEHAYEHMGLLVENCIVTSIGEVSSSGGHRGINVFTIGGIVRNNIVTNCFIGISMGYYNDLYVLNNTCVGNYYNGISEDVDGYYKDVHCRNNLCTGNGNADFYGNIKSSGTDVSGDATSPYVAGRSKTITFESASTGDYTPASTETDLIDQGTNLSSAFGFSADNKGTSRPQGSAWDIGALERIVSSSPAATQSGFIPYYRRFSR